MLFVVILYFLIADRHLLVYLGLVHHLSQHNDANLLQQRRIFLIEQPVIGIIQHQQTVNQQVGQLAHPFWPGILCLQFGGQ